MTRSRNVGFLLRVRLSVIFFDGVISVCFCFVSDVANTVKKQEIYDYFTKYGSITSIKLGKNNQYVVLEFAEPSVAKEVLRLRHQLHNQTLYVRVSRPNRKDTGNSSFILKVIVPYILIFRRQTGTLGRIWPNKCNPP